VQILVTRKTASEAADFARMAAEACPEHGFHKPSGAWWGSDGERFHRFATRGRPPSAALIVLGGSAALGVAAALLRRKRRK
jgi:hypothetical protein